MDEEEYKQTMNLLGVDYKHGEINRRQLIQKIRNTADKYFNGQPWRIVIEE